MVVIAKAKLAQFAKAHPLVAQALSTWYTTVKQQNWRCFADIKLTYNSVDSVGNDRFVFNIKGNEYRLVAMIHFSTRTTYIRFVGTHAEYDKINCSTI